MNNKFIESFLFATIGAKGNIPEGKSKNIAITSSIGSLVSNAPISSLLIAKELKASAEENESLQAEVNNRISTKQVAERMNKIMEFYTAQIATHTGEGNDPAEKLQEAKFIAALGLRVAFSDSHLKLLRKNSTKGLQDIIDVSLTIPDSLPFPQNPPATPSPVAANPPASKQVAAKPVHRQE